MKYYTFPRGGLHYRDSHAPGGEASVTGFLPGLAVVPLSQHSGSKAYPIVSPGDRVTEGALIGRGQGRGSANVHAPAPGRVLRLLSWKTAEGYTNDALVIKMEGSFERLGKREKESPWEDLSVFEIYRLISEAGVVEMEGIGDPLIDKLGALRIAAQTVHPRSIVVRCVFDDPWLAADRILFKERTAAVAEGARIIARLVGTSAREERILLALSYRDIALFDPFKACLEGQGIPLFPVPVGDRYPQSNREELEISLRAFAKKEQLTLGTCFFLGPATLAAVYDAVKLRKPVLERYVAVGGSAVKKPLVLKTRLGTRLGEIFAQCDGFVAKPKRFAMGSPLKGRTVRDLDEPVVKTSSAVFALLEEERPENGRCMNCGECRAVCPLGLDPEELYKSLLRGRGLGTYRRAANCHGCLCCELVCPSALPLGTRIFQSLLEARSAALQTEGA